ncbi:MAG TPA: hypothetical protein VFN97_04290 [Actinospica sp.]|nr:hypothetical protein [Actinospica sp.]
MVLVFVSVALFVLYAVTALSVRSRRRHPPAAQPPDPRRMALEFRGVVVANETMAHAFDPGYSARVEIKCDDGSTVTVDTSIFNQGKYPVGMRVVKRAGQYMPEPDPDPPSDGS